MLLESIKSRKWRVCLGRPRLFAKYSLHTSFKLYTWRILFSSYFLFLCCVPRSSYPEGSFYPLLYLWIQISYYPGSLGCIFLNFIYSLWSQWRWSLLTLYVFVNSVCHFHPWARGLLTWTSFINFRFFIYLSEESLHLNSSRVPLFKFIPIIIIEFIQR